MERDDFEFKPLTDGLGFHKKKTVSDNSTRSKVSSESPFARPNSHMTSTTAARNQTMNFIETEEDARPTTKTPHATLSTRVQNSRPKGREIPVIEDEISPGNKAVDQIIKSFKHNDLDFEQQKMRSNRPYQPSGSTEALKEIEKISDNTSIKLELKSTKKNVDQNKITFEFEKTYPHLLANVLDTMLVLAATMLCMIVLLTITKVDLITHITNPNSDPTIFYAIAGLFFSVILTYNLVTRVFLQATPGEWAFDIQLGDEEQAKSWTYPLKIILRTVIYAITGFFIFALISRLFKKDLIGSLCGLSLNKKV